MLDQTQRSYEMAMAMRDSTETEASARATPPPPLSPPPPSVPRCRRRLDWAEPPLQPDDLPPAIAASEEREVSGSCCPRIRIASNDWQMQRSYEMTTHDSTETEWAEPAASDEQPSKPDDVLVYPLPHAPMPIASHAAASSVILHCRGGTTCLARRCPSINGSRP